MMHGMGFGMGFGWLIWILIIGLAVWFLVKFVANNPVNNQPFKRETPEEILKKRFANGEISSTEYEEMLKKLKEDN